MIKLWSLVNIHVDVMQIIEAKHFIVMIARLVY